VGNYISLKSVFTHNLKGFEIKIPVNKFIVITGPSGSGKSSLAFFTLAALGKQRLLKLLDYTRSFYFKRIEAEVSGPLPAIIALSQGVKDWYPYKTVGEFLGVREFLEAAFFLEGDISCPKCGMLNSFSSPSQIISWYNSLPEGAKFYFLIPIQTKSRKSFEFFLSQGYTRILWGDHEIDISEEFPDLSVLAKENSLYLVLDRMVKREGKLSRLLENIRLSKTLSQGKVFFKLLSGEMVKFNLSKICENCGEILPNYWTICKKCGGKGYLKKEPCNACKGLKFSPWVLESKLCGTYIRKFFEMNISSFYKAWRDFKNKKIFEDFEERLRLAKDLLGGEVLLSTPVFQLTPGQRKSLELALLFSTQVEGCVYIFDEPTLGMDPAQRNKLIYYLKKLVQKGNGVIVVEHDPYFLSQADFIVELGHGGGEKGGYLVAATSWKDFCCSSTITASYMKGEKVFEKIPSKRGEEIVLKSGYSLLKRGINLVWGDLSSRKEELWKILQKEVEKAGFSIIEVESHIKLREKDTVATFSGLWNDLRDFILHLPEVKAKGFGARHFSFFTKEGACPLCQGKGYRQIKSGSFEEKIICEECLGKKLNPEVLSLKVKGFPLFELLDFTIAEIASIFERLSRIKEKAVLMEGLGIDYLKLSQNIFELSGGERNRIILCRKLFQKTLKKDAFIFLSYPLQGLHFVDIQKFINWCHFLIEKGASFVILENNPFAYFLADKIIEPEKGRALFSEEMKKFYQKFFKVSSSNKDFTSFQLTSAAPGMA